METGDLQSKLSEDMGVISWPELERHFARGAVIVAAPGLALLDVAQAMALDDAAVLASWLADGKVCRATDEHARSWSISRPDLRAVVVAPWVVVQVASHH